MQTKRLKEINWVNGKIRFYSSKREDIEPSTSKILNGNPLQKLDSICVFDANNHSIRRFEFRYGYFGEGDFLNKRLKLERIVDKDNPENSHSMEYRENETFPAKNTLSVDYWGYYNGKKYDVPYCMALDSVMSVHYHGEEIFKGQEFNSERKVFHWGYSDDILSVDLGCYDIRYRGKISVKDSMWISESKYPEKKYR